MSIKVANGKIGSECGGSPLDPHEPLDVQQCLSVKLTIIKQDEMLSNAGGISLGTGPPHCLRVQRSQ